MLTSAFNYRMRKDQGVPTRKVRVRQLRCPRHSRTGRREPQGPQGRLCWGVWVSRQPLAKA